MLFGLACVAGGILALPLIPPATQDIFWPFSLPSPSPLLKFPIVFLLLAVFIIHSDWLLAHAYFTITSY